ncbi:MAG: hypothetical protein SFT90_05140, partial [Rickettsiales bacterium]|nr:hypothetical protein [Rickettsiales bacterium]
SPSTGGAISNVELVKSLLGKIPKKHYISVNISGLYDIGNTPAFACTPCNVSQNGVERFETADLRRLDKLFNQYIEGVRNTEKKLNLAKNYLKMHDFRKPEHQIYFFANNEIFFSIKNKNDLSVLRQYFDLLNNILPDESKLNLTHEGNFGIIATSPDNDVLKCLLSDRGVTFNEDPRVTIRASAVENSLLAQTLKNFNNLKCNDAKK